jgi:hypothetical protein
MVGTARSPLGRNKRPRGNCPPSRVRKMIEIPEVFVAPPHAVAMEFDLLGERRSRHWVKGGGDKRERLVEWSAFENRTNCRPDPNFACMAPAVCLALSTFCLLPTFSVNLPPHFIVTRFVYSRFPIFDLLHP